MAPENQLIMDYMIRGNNIGETDVFDAVAIFLHINGNDLIQSILDNRDNIRPVVTNEIPQFSNELDVNNVLRVLLDSGLKDLTYDQVGAYLCPPDSKYYARRKYGENHYKFACQLGLTVPNYPLAVTEIGTAYYLLENDTLRQNLMNRLVFSIPFVQHAIIKAVDGVYSMPEYMGTFLSPSTIVRRRSNMRKIMSWAYSITDGEYKAIFDNIVWF